MRLDRYLRPLANRVRLLVGLGVLDATDEGHGIARARLRLLRGEVRDDVRRMQSYGLNARPKRGAEVLVVAVGGNRSHLVAVAVDDSRARPHDLAEGEVELYTDEGDHIRIKRGGIVEVLAATRVVMNAPEVVINAPSKITFNTPMVEMSGALQVVGAISSTTSIADMGGTMQAIRLTYNGHTHPSGGTPSVPM